MSSLTSAAGGIAVGKGEKVIIRDRDFSLYRIEDGDGDAVLRWESTTASSSDGVVLEIGRGRGRKRVDAFPAIDVRQLPVGQSFRLFTDRDNLDGCQVYPTNSMGVGSDGKLKAVVVDRGGCFFLTKVQMAQAAGYDMVIVVNTENDTEELIAPMLRSEEQEMAGWEEDTVPLLLIIWKEDVAVIKDAREVTLATKEPTQLRLIINGGLSRF